LLRLFFCESRFAFRGQSVLLVAGHCFDEFDAAKAGAGPVFINRNASDALEAEFAEDLPAGVAVDFAFVFL
jgi:hypothetical protein